MMKRRYIGNIKKSLHNKEIKVSGWVEELRDLNKIKFIILRDRTGTAQCTALPKELSKEDFDNISRVTPESVIDIKGIIKFTKQAKRGYEIIIKKWNMHTKAGALPIQVTLKDEKVITDLSKRLDFRYLDLRKPRNLSIFKVRSKIAKILTDFFDKEGFINTNTPKITGAGVESGAALFKVDYFGKQVYLSQSPQIYKQMMVSAGLEKVYEIAPVFRAEKSRTARHLTEFTGVDFEMGFIKDEHDIMDVIEKMMITLLKEVKNECKDELKFFNIDLNVPKNIPRITMDEAKTLLAEKGKKLRPEEDFDPEAERILGEIILKKYKSELVFVYNYPWAVRPFYHMKPEGDYKGTRSFDLIWRGVEIATGAQREHRYSVLKKQAEEKGVKLDEMRDYANIFKHGCPPHGGVGFGLDRITQRLLNIENIREVILLPRDPDRMTP